MNDKISEILANNTEYISICEQVASQEAAVASAASRISLLQATINYTSDDVVTSFNNDTCNQTLLDSFEHDLDAFYTVPTSSSMLLGGRIPAQLLCTKTQLALLNSQNVDTAFTLLVETLTVAPAPAPAPTSDASTIARSTASSTLLLPAIMAFNHVGALSRQFNLALPILARHAGLQIMQLATNEAGAVSKALGSTQGVLGAIAGVFRGKWKANQRLGESLHSFKQILRVFVQSLSSLPPIIRDAVVAEICNLAADFVTSHFFISQNTPIYPDIRILQPPEIAAENLSLLASELTVYSELLASLSPPPPLPSRKPYLGLPGDLRGQHRLSALAHVLTLMCSDVGGAISALQALPPLVSGLDCARLAHHSFAASERRNNLEKELRTLQTFPGVEIRRQGASFGATCAGLVPLSSAATSTIIPWDECGEVDVLDEQNGIRIVHNGENGVSIVQNACVLVNNTVFTVFAPGLILVPKCGLQPLPSDYKVCDAAGLVLANESLPF